MYYSRRSKHCELSKRWLLILSAVLVALFAGFFFAAHARAEEQKNTVNVYLFWGEGCPHCENAKQTLEPYFNQQTNVNYYDYEVYYNPENVQKIQAVGTTLGIEANGVPLILVGNTPFVGFSSATGNEVIDRIEHCSVHACADDIAEVVGVQKPAAEEIIITPTEPKPEPEAEQPRQEKFIDIPFFGTVNTAHFSLPVLTVIIGLLDGFNPCAMWALLFIISLLIGMKDRKKMWLYGATFIATSAIVYFAFLAMWLQVFTIIGHITWIRTLIGLFALGIGSYYLYEWQKNQTGCKVTGTEKRQKVFEKLRTIIKEKNILLGLGGIVLLAIAVNMVELACSAGLPALYAGILETAGLPAWQNLAYMLLYILFFMLDDLIVFAIAMITLQIVGVEPKYVRIIRFIGGALMIILGLLLIFAPELLMFG